MESQRGLAHRHTHPTLLQCTVQSHITLNTQFQRYNHLACRHHHRLLLPLLYKQHQQPTPSGYKSRAIRTQASSNKDIDYASAPPKPGPLDIPLLDTTIQTSVDELWRSMVSEENSLLYAFHKDAGDSKIRLHVDWENQEPGVTVTVTLTYLTPIVSPLPWAPKTARNTEVLQFSYILGGQGFTVTGNCVTEGVPLADSFKNYLYWVVKPTAEGTTSISITAETKIHGKIVSPVRSIIRKESKTGMKTAYSHLPLLLTTFPFQRSLGTTLRPLLKEVESLQAAKLFCAQRWPSWAADRYWLVGNSNNNGNAITDASCRPTPTQAVEILSHLTTIALSMKLAQRQQVFARDPLIIGLVECWRVVPPRRLSTASVFGGGSNGSGGYSGGGGKGGGRHNGKKIYSKPTTTPTTRSSSSSSSSGTTTTSKQEQQEPEQQLPSSLLCEAISLLGCYGQELYWFDEMEALCARLPELTPEENSIKNVTVALWGLGSTRHYTPHLDVLEGLLVTYIQNGFDGNQKNRMRISASIEKLAFFGYVPTRLFDAVADVLNNEQDVCQWPIRGLARMAWGVAITDSLDGKLCSALLDSVLMDRSGVRPDPGHYSMMHQLFLSLQIRRPEVWAEFKQRAANSTTRIPTSTTTTTTLNSSSTTSTTTASPSSTLDDIDNSSRSTMRSEDSDDDDDDDGSSSSGDEGSGIEISSDLDMSLIRPNPPPISLLNSDDDDDDDAVSSSSSTGGGASGDEREVSISERLPGTLIIAEAQRNWEDMVSWQKSVSSVQQDTYNALCALGYNAKLETVVLGISVDIAVEDEKLVVEVDGPHHYTRNPREQPRLVGNLLWKKRLLTESGWSVLNVDANYFGRLRAPERKAYLKEQLDELF